MSDASFARDANRVPLTQNGLVVSKAVTFTANGTVAKILFHVTGTVLVNALYGIVTTDIGSNHTAAHWRINDQTITTQVISAAAGTTVSSLKAGTMLSRTSLVSVALVASTAATGLVTDPVAATSVGFFMPFTVTQKTGSIQTDIEYVYTTNNTSLGAMTFYCGFVPLSPTGDVVAA
jgi:hypothetical protein